MKKENSKQGASMGDVSAFDDQDSFYRSVNMVLAGIETCVGYAVNHRDVKSLTSIQTITNELYRRAAECLDRGCKYKVAGPN